MTENGSFLAKKGRVGRVNFNLYHYAGNSPVRYTDPNGRSAYSIKNGDGSYSFTTSTNLFEKEMINSFGFIPFGGSGISLMFRLCGIREITDSNAMEIATYATDSLGNFDKFNSVIDLSKFAKVGKVAGNIGTGLTLYSLGSEFFGRESLTIDNVISKTVGSYIKGKSHEAVSKSYNYAKSQILKMISTGKLSYKANKNCEIEYIKFDKETHSEIKNLIKELKQMEQNNE